jgi:hypothetical protein
MQTKLYFEHLVCQGNSYCILEASMNLSRSLKTVPMTLAWWMKTLEKSNLKTWATIGRRILLKDFIY